MAITYFFFFSQHLVAIRSQFSSLSIIRHLVPIGPFFLIVDQRGPCGHQLLYFTHYQHKLDLTAMKFFWFRMLLGGHQNFHLIIFEWRHTLWPLDVCFPRHQQEWHLVDTKLFSFSLWTKKALGGKQVPFLLVIHRKATQWSLGDLCYSSLMRIAPSGHQVFLFVFLDQEGTLWPLGIIFPHN